MTQSSALWGILQHHVPKNQWISTQEIFSIVESHSTFDHEDLTLHVSNVLQWKFNVRRLLQEKTKEGSLKGRVKK